MEHINDLQLVAVVWTMLSQPIAQDNRAKGLGILSLIASKGISLALSAERIETLLPHLQNPAIAIEAVKAIAFMAMQGQNKPLLTNPRVLTCLFNTMASNSEEMDLQWASMAIYYLASSGVYRFSLAC
jgi:hypothetical protein